jgi:hypothetical protein
MSALRLAATSAAPPIRAATLTMIEEPSMLDQYCKRCIGGRYDDSAPGGHFPRSRNSRIASAAPNIKDR